MLLNLPNSWIYLLNYVLGSPVLSCVVGGVISIQYLFFLVGFVFRGEGKLNSIQDSLSVILLGQNTLLDSGFLGGDSSSDRVKRKPRVQVIGLGKIEHSFLV